MTFFAILPNHLLSKDGKVEENDSDKHFVNWAGMKNIDVRESIAFGKARIYGFFTRLVELLDVTQLIMKGAS